MKTIQTVSLPAHDPLTSAALDAAGFGFSLIVLAVGAILIGD